MPNNVMLRAAFPAVNAANPQADYSRELGYNGNRVDMGAYGNSWQAPQNPPLSQMAVSLDAPLSEQSGSTGQTVSYTLTLKNSGSVVDYYTVSIAESRFPAKMDESGFEGPRQFFLTPQEAVTMTIWVEIPLFTSNFTNTTAVRAANGYGIEAQVELTTSVEASFQEVDGQVVMEGEHFNNQIERNGQRWLSQDSLAGYVGSGYAAALPDTDTLFGAGYATTSPELQYSLNLTTTGVYTVWLRGYAPNGAGDSLHIALDNQPATIVTDFVPRTWAWGHKDNTGLPVTIEVSEAGVHTLHLWQREDGFRLDRILLTIDSDYNPTGDGPPESPIQ